MALKSYIGGFTTYPVDTREMLSSTDLFLSNAAEYAYTKDNITLTPLNSKYEWVYDGGIAFLVVFYDDFTP